MKGIYLIQFIFYFGRARKFLVFFTKKTFLKFAKFKSPLEDLHNHFEKSKEKCSGTKLRLTNKDVNLQNQAPNWWRTPEISYKAPILGHKAYEIIFDVFSILIYHYERLEAKFLDSARNFRIVVLDIIGRTEKIMTFFSWFSNAGLLRNQSDSKNFSFEKNIYRRKGLFSGLFSFILY